MILIESLFLKDWSKMFIASVKIRALLSFSFFSEFFWISFKCFFRYVFFFNFFLIFFHYFILHFFDFFFSDLFLCLQQLKREDDLIFLIWKNHENWFLMLIKMSDSKPEGRILQTVKIKVSWDDLKFLVISTSIWRP